jgi:hypothetical protein
MGSIYEKLAAVKSEIGKLSKDSTNPFYKSKYFDINALLEHVEPRLDEHGLLLLQPIIDGKVYSRIIEIETGKLVESFLELPTYTDPQKTGICVTYFRRYTLQSLLGIQAEDSDGQMSKDTSNDDTVKDDSKPWLNIGSKEWINAVTKKISIDQVREFYKLSKANAEAYSKEIA